jgi:hypothetical protein
MSRRHRKAKHGSIHQYLTRQNSESSNSGDIAVRNEPEKSEREKMAAEVSNTELKGLILGLEAKLDKKLDDGFEKVTERVDKLSDKLEVLEVDVDNVKQSQAKDHEKMEKMEQELGELRRSLLLTQVYSRKYHLLLYGVEGFESSPAACIERVRKFASENLKLDEDFAKKLVIRNAHRLQKRDVGPTPIIVVFLYWQQRDAFMRAGRNLAGTKMSVRTDLPPVLKQRRGQLASAAYEIRRDEHVQARVQEKGIDVWIETRKSSTDPWVKRIISL